MTSTLHQYLLVATVGTNKSPAADIESSTSSLPPQTPTPYQRVSPPSVSRRRHFVSRRRHFVFRRRCRLLRRSRRLSRRRLLFSQLSPSRSPTITVVPPLPPSVRTAHPPFHSQPLYHFVTPPSRHLSSTYPPAVPSARLLYFLPTVTIQS
jgi:hypothetical protein